MTRLLALAPAALLCLAASAGGQARDSLAEAGYRDGRAAAEARGVGGYGLLGALTGLAAGGIGTPLLLFGHGELRLIGAAAIVPIFLTHAQAGRSRPEPPPDVEREIQLRPSSYRQTFRHAYADRLSQRRRRAVRIGGLTGGVVGAVTVVGLIAYAIANIGNY